MTNEQAALIAAAMAHGSIITEEVSTPEVIKTAREFVIWLDRVGTVTKVIDWPNEQVLCTGDCGTVTNWDLSSDPGQPLMVKCSVCGRWMAAMGNIDPHNFRIQRHAPMEPNTSEE